MRRDPLGADRDEDEPSGPVHRQRLRRSTGDAVDVDHGGHVAEGIAVDGRHRGRDDHAAGLDAQEGIGLDGGQGGGKPEGVMPG